MGKETKKVVNFLEEKSASPEKLLATPMTSPSANFTEGNILLKKCTQTINNRIKLHILGVSMNKLGN